MLDDKIKKWVDDSINQGYSIEKIKQNLINFGYIKEEVDLLTKDLKEIKKPVVELKTKTSIENIKERILNYYVLIPALIVLAALIISALFVFGKNSEDNSVFCSPISISLQRACKLDDKIIISVKNEGITFSKFKYYINDKLANEKDFIFYNEKIVYLSIKLSIFEEREIKSKFPEINYIKFVPISNEEECADKSITIPKILNSC